MIISRLCIWRKGLLTDANFRVESPQDFINFRQQWQVWGSPKIILGFPNQLVLQGLTESCYTCSYGLFQIFDLFLIHFLFLMQYNGFAVLIQYFIFWRNIIPLFKMLKPTHTQRWDMLMKSAVAATGERELSFLFFWRKEMKLLLFHACLSLSFNLC